MSKAVSAWPIWLFAAPTVWRTLTSCLTTPRKHNPRLLWMLQSSYFYCSSAHCLPPVPGTRRHLKKPVPGYPGPTCPHRIAHPAPDVPFR